MSAVLLYMTAADDAEARALASRLVESRLVACVNILGAIQSLFHWQGVQNEGEVALVAKTRAELVPTINTRLQAWHSYDCPCLIALPIVDGNPAFLDWIATETADPL